MHACEDPCVPGRHPARDAFPLVGVQHDCWVSNILCSKPLSGGLLREGGTELQKVLGVASC